MSRYDRSYESQHLEECGNIYINIYHSEVNSIDMHKSSSKIISKALASLIWTDSIIDRGRGARKIRDAKKEKKKAVAYDILL